MPLPSRNQPANRPANTQNEGPKKDYGFFDEAFTMVNGKLGGDPKFFGQEKGKIVLSVSLAVSAGNDKEGKPHTNWYEIVVFGKKAEDLQAADVFRKGDYVTVLSRGVPSMEEYPKKDNAGVGYKMKLIASDIMMRFRAPKNEATGQAESSDEGGYAGQPSVR